jgi:UDP-3-O-[3-hydroxymyristoyl] glucosamine N-acyltransferase
VNAGEIAALLGAELVGDASLEITGINAIEKASYNELTFLSNKKYEKYLFTTKASCIVVDKSVDVKQFSDKTFIICEDSYFCFAQVVRTLYGFKQKQPFIGEKTTIADSAQIDKSSRIEDFVFIEENVVVGKNTTIMPFVYIGKNSKIGDNCIIYPSVTIREDSVVGNNVIIHSSSVIGSDGFGYAHTKNNEHIKIPQIGNVVIEDDVEIGSNVSIDRAALDSTVVKKGAKIDNLVQIAHNVEIGENTIVVAQTGISGSTKIGKNVILAGQTGIAGHLDIADGVIITAKSGVGSSIKKPGVYSGIPIYDHSKWLRSSAVMPKLSDMYKRLRELEKEIEELKKK